MSFKKAVGIVSILLLVAVLLRIPHVKMPLINIDEAFHAVIARIFLNGGVIYRDAVENMAPLIHLFFALIFSLFGKNNMTALHGAVIGLILIQAILLFLISRLLDPSYRMGCYSVLFFTLFSYTYPLRDMFALNSEWLAVLFTTLGAYCLTNYIILNRRFFLVPCGFLYGLAFFTKHAALLDFGVALGVCLASALKWGQRKSDILKSAGGMLAGFVLAGGFIVYYFYSHQALKDFWFGFWEYNAHYYVSQIPLGVRSANALASVWTDPDAFLKVNFFLFLFFLSGLGHGIRLWRQKNNAPSFYVEIFFLGWCVSSYLGASLSGRNFGHYYIMILPAFCLISARMTLVIQEAISHLGSSRRGENSKQTQNLLPLKVFFSIFVIWGLGSPLLTYLLDRKPWAFYWGEKMLSHNLPLDLKMLTDYIRRYSSEKDKIFVWGFNPDIYLFSERMPATRYMNSHYLTGLVWTGNPPPPDTSATIVPGSWDILMEELVRNRPLFIVDTSFGDNNFYGRYPIWKFERLFHFLKENYILEKEFFIQAQPTFRLFKRKDVLIDLSTLKDKTEEGSSLKSPGKMTGIFLRFPLVFNDHSPFFDSLMP